MSTTLILLLALASAEPEATPAEPTVTASEQATADDQAPIPEKIPSTGEELVPTVSIRTADNGDRVEEYRLGNRITMVKVTPQRGPSYTLLDTNGDGKLDEVDGEPNGGVTPVYWTLYEWN